MVALAACVGRSRENASTHPRVEARPTSSPADESAAGIASLSDAGARMLEVPPDALVFSEACVPRKLRIPAHIELECFGAANTVVRFLRPLCIEGSTKTRCITEPRMFCSNLSPVVHGDVMAELLVDYFPSDEDPIHVMIGDESPPPLSLASATSLSRQESIIEDCCRTIRWESTSESAMVVLEGRIAHGDDASQWSFHSDRTICLPGHVGGDDRAQKRFPMEGPAAEAVPDGGVSVYGDVILRAAGSPSGPRSYVADFSSLMEGPLLRIITPWSGENARRPRFQFYPKKKNGTKTTTKSSK